MVTFEEFQKMDCRVGKIQDVSDHPNADRLLLLTVDIGEEEPAQSVAGIKGHYDAEELIGRDVVVLANMEPASIRGETSEVMVLAATEGEEVVLMQPDPDRAIKPGTKVE